jgi:hypothetical protein
MAELKGWLLDLFADTQPGVVLWLLGEDGQRHRLTQDFRLPFTRLVSLPPTPTMALPAGSA